MDFIITAILQGIGFSAMGIGVFLSLRIFSIPDITTDGSYTLGGVITAVGLTASLNPIIVLVLALSSGAIAGACTGIIHTRLKVNALLAGILVMTSLYSVNIIIMGRSNLPLIDVKTIFDFIPLSSNYNNYLIILVLISILLLLLMNWLLRTDFGIAMRATGNSETMVTAIGVNASSMKIIGLTIANMCTALSGFLLVQYQGYADINMGIGIVISGLGSVMIGESVIVRMKNKSLLIQLLSVVIGCIVFRLVLATVLSLGLDPNYLKLLTSIIVLIFVAMGNLKSTVRS